MTIQTPILTSTRGASTTQIITNKTDAKFVESYFVSDYEGVVTIIGDKTYHELRLYLVLIDGDGKLRFNRRDVNVDFTDLDSMTLQDAINSPDISGIVGDSVCCNTVDTLQTIIGGTLSSVKKTIVATITAYTPLLTATAEYNSADYYS